MLGATSGDEISDAPSGGPTVLSAERARIGDQPATGPLSSRDCVRWGRRRACQSGVEWIAAV